ncbi:hypothetical protein WICMUC_001748 [Wickerhamomyces mucosus]|uniref:Uncharacterized protein n=1 Tax=Wickerhamomyces mucosus TaxID=1378264 RepID=A0A9P8TGD9_9ASCO|nr:hypothetical protein WICMUC_001748 [Wickerhamomyces mucosus]
MSNDKRRSLLFPFRSSVGNQKEAKFEVVKRKNIPASGFSQSSKSKGIHPSPFDDVRRPDLLNYQSSTKPSSQILKDSETKKHHNKVLQIPHIGPDHKKQLENNIEIPSASMLDVSVNIPPVPEYNSLTFAPPVTIQGRQISRDKKLPLPRRKPPMLDGKTGSTLSVNTMNSTNSASSSRYELEPSVISDSKDSIVDHSQGTMLSNLELRPSVDIPADATSHNDNQDETRIITPKYSQPNSGIIIKEALESPIMRSSPKLATVESNNEEHEEHEEHAEHEEHEEHAEHEEQLYQPLIEDNMKELTKNPLNEESGKFKLITSDEVGNIYVKTPSTTSPGALRLNPDISTSLANINKEALLPPELGIIQSRSESPQSSGSEFFDANQDLVGQLGSNLSFRDNDSAKSLIQSESKSGDFSVNGTDNVTDADIIKIKPLNFHKKTSSSVSAQSLTPLQTTNLESSHSKKPSLSDEILKDIDEFQPHFISYDGINEEEFDEVSPVTPLNYRTVSSSQKVNESLLCSFDNPDRAEISDASKFRDDTLFQDSSDDSSIKKSKFIFPVAKDECDDSFETKDVPNEIYERLTEISENKSLNTDDNSPRKAPLPRHYNGEGNFAFENSKSEAKDDETGFNFSNSGNHDDYDDYDYNDYNNERNSKIDYIDEISKVSHDRGYADKSVGSRRSEPQESEFSFDIQSDELETTSKTFDNNSQNTKSYIENMNGYQTNLNEEQFQPYDGPRSTGLRIVNDGNYSDTDVDDERSFEIHSKKNINEVEAYNVFHQSDQQMEKKSYTEIENDDESSNEVLSFTAKSPIQSPFIIEGAMEPTFSRSVTPLGSIHSSAQQSPVQSVGSDDSNIPGLTGLSIQVSPLSHSNSYDRRGEQIAEPVKHINQYHGVSRRPPQNEVNSSNATRPARSSSVTSPPPNAYNSIGDTKEEHSIIFTHVPERSNYVERLRLSSGTANSDVSSTVWGLPIGISDSDDLKKSSTLNLRSKYKRAQRPNMIDLKHGKIKPRLLASEIDEDEDEDTVGSLLNSRGSVELERLKTTNTTSTVISPSRSILGSPNKDSIARGNFSSEKTDIGRSGTILESSGPKSRLTLFIANPDVNIDQ